MKFEDNSKISFCLALEPIPSKFTTQFAFRFPFVDAWLLDIFIWMFEDSPAMLLLSSKKCLHCISKHEFFDVSYYQLSEVPEDVQLHSMKELSKLFCYL